MSRPPVSTLARRAGADLWASRPLPTWARVLIVVAALLSASSDLLNQGPTARADATSRGTDIVLVLLAHAAVVIMAFWVSIGAAILAGTMSVSIFTETGSLIGLLGLAASGVVAGKASRPFAVLYVLFCFLWLAGSVVIHEHARDSLFATGTLLAVSTAIGATYAALSERNKAAVERIEGFEEERKETIKGERNRIARELHDIVAHHITMASMHASVLTMVKDPEQQDKSLRIIAGATRQALTELRWMLHVLQSDEDETGTDEETALDLRLAATLASIRQNLEALGFRTTIEYDPKVLAGLPGEIDLALGRILQEAATNVVKHGDPSQSVRISVLQTSSAVHLVLRNGVADNHTATLPSSGMGLENMRTRASQRGGTVQASRDGNTWVLRSELPLR